ncbi:hypothetical protein AURDEDRAFT_177517 [Auricularia subglabra TFB-10046 SS5]|uniref:Uncharacterized protein n=1 Tax=Auricularia subglabra (strain TFB-10046 / SS5) TaxID=717982 RepID=J0WNH3_AURST|nr:hypothetical protein AURDEDRAFT_177517 [Auricularia subglabra TFB-10046 SS5]
MELGRHATTPGMSISSTLAHSQGFSDANPARLVSALDDGPAVVATVVLLARHAAPLVVRRTSAVEVVLVHDC